MAARSPGRSMTGPGGGLDVDPEFGSDDVGQGGLSQPRGSAEKDMVQRLSPVLGGLDEDPEVILHFLLPDVFLQRSGAEG